MGIIGTIRRSLRHIHHSSAGEPARRSPMGGYAVIDVETTGLSPKRERILELGIVATDTTGAVVSEWLSRFNPQGSVGATHIHGITDDDVAHAPLFADRIEEIVPLLRDRVLVAHNATFDLAFMREEFVRAGWTFPVAPRLCTLRASWVYQPDLMQRRLPDCCRAARVKMGTAHAALDDARATAALLHHFLDPRRRPPKPLDEHLGLVDRAIGVAWPTGRTSEPHPTPARTDGPARRTAPARLAPSLRSTLADFSFEDALHEGAPSGSAAYLQLVFEAVEDGHISLEEARAIEELAGEYSLSLEDRETAHRGFLAALARKAVEDNRVTQDERQELRLVAQLLNLGEKAVTAVLGDARSARTASLEAGLPALPDGWSHGEPLRVADRVAFTGCETIDRVGLEAEATLRGVTVTNSVSRGTALLVSDGTFAGSKAAAATEYGIRVVHPDVFTILLKHIQPRRPQR